MAVRKVIRFPDPTLRKTTTEVKEFSSDLQELINDMIDTMFAYKGAGLAAIQIGSLHRIYVIDSTAAGLSEKDPPLVFVNPTIEVFSKETEVKEEGCLSFPSIFIPVKRSLSVRTTSLDRHGNPQVITASGFYARAMQHEQDHLDNRLLYDFAGPLRKKSIQRKMEHMTDEEAWDLLLEHGE